MPDGVTMEKLENNLAFFRKMYDVVRLVDPLHKVVVEYKGCDREKTDETCFEYWKSGNICSNCISVRCHFENKCFMKLEQSDAAIMMVTALPIENADKPTVIELLKNATDTMLIGSGVYTDGHMMKNIVAEINALAVKDELTGLFNRRYIHERLAADVVKAALEERPLSVIFLDIDNLKLLNDALGHRFGDEVLVNVANVLMSCADGNSDWVARYGGDEFLICLNNTPEESAGQTMQRIHDRIDSLELAFGGEPMRISASMGAYTMLGEANTPDEIIALADKRMYEAKWKKHSEDK